MTVSECQQSSDYPAAHSMDATWFAVDRDGHVALFEAGDTVPIPEAAAQINHAFGYDVETPGIREVLSGPVKSEIVFDLEGLEIPPLQGPRHLTAADDCGGQLLFVSSRRKGR